MEVIDELDKINERIIILCDSFEQAEDEFKKYRATYKEMTMKEIPFGPGDIYRTIDSINSFITNDNRMYTFMTKEFYEYFLKNKMDEDTTFTIDLWEFINSTYDTVWVNE